MTGNDRKNEVWSSIDPMTLMLEIKKKEFEDMKQKNAKKIGDLRLCLFLGAKRRRFTVCG